MHRVFAVGLCLVGVVGCPTAAVDPPEETPVPAPTTPPAPMPMPPPPPPPPVPVSCIDVDAIVDLGERVLASTAPALGTVEIRSVCDATLEVSGLQLLDDGGIFALGAPLEGPLEIPSGEAASFEVSAVPTDYGAFSATLAITSNDAAQPTVTVDVRVASVCESVALDIDTDADGVPDGCDLCDEGPDTDDADLDGIPDACDVCAAGNDLDDADADGVADACDLCEGADDTLDVDLDAVPDACDLCLLGPNNVDTDADGTPDPCDVCPDADDGADADADGVPDGCDLCEGGDDGLDADSDVVPDACDVCAGFDDLADADFDLVPDGCDVCDGDDQLDSDADGLPDDCDPCVLGPESDDADGDGVADACDQCANADDALDADADTVPDGCDVCGEGNDLDDTDGDTVPDACDRCANGDDAVDGDLDGIADACDVCPGSNDAVDSDGDGLPNGCDPCVFGPESDDADQDGVADACDQCANADDALDADADTVPDGCDRCPGSNDLADVDLDGTPDQCDTCYGWPDLDDTDGDGVPDGCDLCRRGDDASDLDSDGVPDACDRCDGFDDAVDIDRDGFPDRTPDCDTCVGAAQVATLANVPLEKADFLFVIDDSCSSAQEQASIANGFGDFAAELASREVDWQIGVISTTSSALQGPILTPSSSASAFATQINIGTGGFGLEQGIQRAYDATLPGGAAGPGSSFLRTDALLAIVFVSDELDASTVTPSVALAHWEALKGDPERVIVHGFVQPSPDGYAELIDTTGGVRTFPPGYPSAGPELAEMVRASFDDVAVPLATVPVWATLEVREAGLVNREWVYDAPTNAVVFPVRPAVGATVTVDYVEDCGGAVHACADGLDNDGDGLVDYPEEPGCRSASDVNETDPFFAPTCADSIDNDGDGATDFPVDLECVASADASESCTFVADDAFGYSACFESGAAATCPDLAGEPTALPLGDEGTVLVPLGFSFDFYGVPRTDVYVGANGTLSFDADTSPPANQCLGEASPNDMIYVWWDDLNPNVGDVWVRTAGVAPRRALQVQWRVAHLNGGLIDVRAVLHEGTNDVDLCYVDTSAGVGIDDGASATSGIQGPVTRIETSCFSADLSAGTVVRFDHP